MAFGIADELVGVWVVAEPVGDVVGGRAEAWVAETSVARTAVGISVV